MSHRKIVLVACAAALALAGCGNSVQGSPADVAAQEKPAEPAAASTPAPTSATPGGGSRGGGGKLTPTGTTLKVGQTATVEYETKNLAKATTRLAITAKSVRKGAIADLKGFNLDAQTKVSEPFYVTMTFKNVGPRPMEPGGIFGLVNAHNTDGDELNRLSLLGEFTPCEGTPPKTLKVGAAYTECDVYVAPAGQDVGKVVFGHFIDTTETEITWKVG
ncbi:MAG TPA: hypothetical protein VGP26_26510 [Actinophytocola sp.]|jgi:hypothetical protein|nr:hypothetical protein [Actinophytocola sp.]